MTVARLASQDGIGPTDRAYSALEHVNVRIIAAVYEGLGVERIEVTVSHDFQVGVVGVANIDGKDRDACIRKPLGGAVWLVALRRRSASNNHHHAVDIAFRVRAAPHPRFRGQCEIEHVPKRFISESEPFG